MCVGQGQRAVHHIGQGSMHNLTDDGSCVPDQCVQDLDTQVHGQDATAQDPGPTQEHSIDTERNHQE